ncbi:unnamed protein product [Adineta steineri]|uniref:CENP-V/GFA domain-containing protein n=2 Tax=Adineta steineri TaxID=433720 RepID=A0A815SQQ3_9BILA|nr:unnamed protein product [Adineta steineri]CAF1493982.1 unnamed protein product [Adineta steineri]CAF4196650.1 unnamed protein product [Adineta steineri]
MTTSTISSKCLCGHITVSIPQTEFNKTDSIGLCYCKTCRQIGGCLASYNLYILEKDVRMEGQPTIYEDKNTDSGTTIQRAFCSNCGSSIYGKNPKSTGPIALRLGMFDELPKPGMALYCKRRPDWLKPIDDIDEH